MTTHQKLAEYKSRLERWRDHRRLNPNSPAYDNGSKPAPENFGLADAQELFMAKKIHDEVTKRS